MVGGEWVCAPIIPSPPTHPSLYIPTWLVYIHTYIYIHACMHTYHPVHAHYLEVKGHMTHKGVAQTPNTVQ